MLCDVDHFKLVNDEFGHSTGDGVPRELARRLRHSVRSYDMVGRFGGEEFLVILNKCEPESATTRAESLEITIRIGVGLSIDFEEQSVDELVASVDAALYSSKSAGRNCVRIAQSKGATQRETTSLRT
jgi:GGDEF domain-containing protein